MFSCANDVRVLREVIGIDLGNAAFQFEDAGITGSDDFVFGSDSLFKRSNAGLFLCDLLIQCGNSLGMCGLDRLQKGFEHLRHKVGLIRSRREIDLLIYLFFKLIRMDFLIKCQKVALAS